MRVYFLSADDQVFLPSFFDQVIAKIGAETVGLAIVSDSNFFKFLKKSFFFLGPLSFMREIGSQLIIRCKRLIIGAVMPSKVRSIESVCRANNVPFRHINKVNSKEFRDFLSDLKVDLLVSVACPQILRKKVLEIPAKGCINIHYGLLPNYRGQYPSFWVLANGEKETGATVHYMVEEIDAGDILVQVKEDIEPQDTFYSLVGKLKTTVGPQALLMALDMIRNDNITTMKNDPKSGTYFSFPTKVDMQMLKKRGRKWR